MAYGVHLGELMQMLAIGSSLLRRNLLLLSLLVVPACASAASDDGAGASALRSTETAAVTSGAYAFDVDVLVTFTEFLSQQPGHLSGTFELVPYPPYGSKLRNVRYALALEKTDDFAGAETAMTSLDAAGQYELGLVVPGEAPWDDPTPGYTTLLPDHRGLSLTFESRTVLVPAAKDTILGKAIQDEARGGKLYALRASLKLSPGCDGQMTSCDLNLAGIAIDEPRWGLVDGYSTLPIIARSPFVVRRL